MDSSKELFGIQVDFNSGARELMIFAAEEYDAGASLQASYAPASQHIKRAFNGRREAQPSRFFFSNFSSQKPCM
jgi:hypothetical protein